MRSRPLSPLVVRAALAISVVFIGVEPAARAADQSMAPTGASAPGDSTAAVAWGVRMNGGVGLASLAEVKNGGGAAWRAGLDAEYWLSRNFGLGMQLGFQELGTFDFCPGGCSSERAMGASMAPSISVRGNKTAIPTVSLAFGLSWVHTETDKLCDTCYPAWSYSASNGWGPYASLTAAWVFHPGDVRPASRALAIGPLVRADLLTAGWTFTTGIAIGFDVAREAPR